MSAWLRFLGFAALLGSCNFADGGNWFGPPIICGWEPPLPLTPRVYSSRDTTLGRPSLTLRIAEADYDPWVNPALLITHPLDTNQSTDQSFAYGTVSRNLDRGFDFKGVDYTSGELVTRSYQWERSEGIVSDITDPANPITLSRQKEPTAPFPWTATFVVSALAVGGLVGRYSAKRDSRRSEKTSLRGV
jgi:hypothetical protein